MAGVWNRNLQGYLRAKAIGFAEQGYATIYGTNGQPITTAKPQDTTHNMYGFRGTNIAALSIRAYGSSYSFAASATTMLLAFGSGDDEPSVNDYKLEATVAPTINNVTHGTYTYANGVASRTITVTVQNPNVTAMTIQEWGLFGVAYDGGSDSMSTSTSVVLLYRALLDTPVTLQQYDTATFTLTLQLTVASES